EHRADDLLHAAPPGPSTMWSIATIKAYHMTAPRRSRASLTAPARASLSKRLEHGTASPAMALRLLERKFPNDHLPLLRWLMFTGVCAFGFVLAWHYGLFHLMLASDKTYISATICVLYLAATAHCFARTVAISHETDSAQRVFSLVSNGARDLRVVGADVMAGDGKRLPPGQVTGHIRNLILKAGLQGRHRVDQTLLLRGLADALRGPNQLGSFASDALMKLGLLGTIIGFILMLAPIAGLDAADRASVKSSMGLMSD